MNSLAVVANVEPVVAGQPRHCPFDHPSVTAESFGGLDSLAGDTNCHTAPTNPQPELGLVIGFVGVQLARPAASRAAPGPHRRNRHDEGFQRLRIVDVGSRNRYGQRDSCPIGQDMLLGSRLASVGRVRAGQIAPFFARTLAASATTRDQSIKP